MNTQATGNSSVTPETADHPVIYLEPAGYEDPMLGRNWCQDDPWSGVDGYDDAKPTRYIRADLVEAKDAEIERLRTANKNLRAEKDALIHDNEQLLDIASKEASRP